METCYGCRYLCQGGDGVDTCMRFDHDGPLQGSMLHDDPPRPLYSDCYEQLSGSKFAGRRTRRETIKDLPMNALGRYLLLTGLLDDFRETVEADLLALANDKQPQQILEWIAERFEEHIKGREIERNPRIHKISG